MLDMVFPVATEMDLKRFRYEITDVLLRSETECVWVRAHTHIYTDTHLNIFCQVKESMAVLERRHCKCANYEVRLKIKAIFTLRFLCDRYVTTLLLKIGLHIISITQLKSSISAYELVPRNQGLTVTRTLTNH